MAIILNPTAVVCEVDRFVCRDDGEAVGGSEPYLWSVFFKIDGEDGNATASVEVTDGGVSLRLDGEPTVTSPDQGSHGNLRLDGGSVDAGGLFSGTKIVDIPSAVGRFRTTLTPIATTIAIAPDSWVAETIDDVVLTIQDILDALAGDQSCPPLDGEPSQLVGEFLTEFVTGTVGGIPGVFGAVYMLMEEDFTSEEAAEDARRALRDAFRDELANTVMPAISLASQTPSEATTEEIEVRVQQAVTDAIVAGINWWWLFLGLPGVAIIADQDDPLGATQPQMSHLQIALGEEQEIDAQLPVGGHGDWSLRGRIGPDI